MSKECKHLVNCVDNVMPSDKRRGGKFWEANVNDVFLG